MAESSIAIEKTDSQLGIAEGDRDDQDAVVCACMGHLASHPGSRGGRFGWFLSYHNKIWRAARPDLPRGEF